MWVYPYSCSRNNLFQYLTAETINTTVLTGSLIFIGWRQTNILELITPFAFGHFTCPKV
jgi:hypothetical protein